MHSKTTFIFLNVCMVRNLKMQSGMLDRYVGAVTALSLQHLLAWKKSTDPAKMWSASHGSNLAVPQTLEVLGQDTVCCN